MSDQGPSVANAVATAMTSAGPAVHWGGGPFEPVPQNPPPFKLGSNGRAHHKHRRTSQIAKTRDLIHQFGNPVRHPFFPKKSALNRCQWGQIRSGPSSLFSRPPPPLIHTGSRPHLRTLKGTAVFRAACCRWRRDCTSSFLVVIMSSTPRQLQTVRRVPERNEQFVETTRPLMDGC